MTTLLATAIRTATDRILFWLILVNLGFSCMGWSLPALPLNGLLPKRLRARAGQFTAMVWCRYFVWSMKISGRIHCDLTALDVLRNEPRLIIVPNHPSMLDALLVISRLPHITCLTKASLFNNFFFGGGIRLAGYIRNDAPRQLLREAADVLAGPGIRQILIFPEGTRSAAGSLSPFRPGFAAIARRTGAIVQTVQIEVNSPYLGKTWPLFRAPEFPLIYRVRLGRRFTVSGSPQDFTAMLERYFREELALPAAEPAV